MLDKLDKVDMLERFVKPGMIGNRLKLNKQICPKRLRLVHFAIWKNLILLGKIMEFGINYFRKWMKQIFR